MREFGFKRSPGRWVLPALLTWQLLPSAPPARAMVLTVNTASYSSGYEGDADGTTLSLAEALRIANDTSISDGRPGVGGLDCIDNGEKAQISGGIWEGGPFCWLLPDAYSTVPDEILFAASYTIQVSSIDFLGDGDRVFGNNSILDGTGGSSSGLKLAGAGVIGAGSLVRDLTLRDFSFAGILCDGCKDAEFYALLLIGNGTGFLARSNPGTMQNPNELRVGSPAGGGNLIVSNINDGIQITADAGYDFPADFDIVIRYNNIGDDGTLNDVGNGGDGIELENIRWADIGGTGTDYGNVINFNNSYGIRIRGASGDSNFVEGNHIGLDESGFLARGNSQGGVRLEAGASGNFIRNNWIAGNGGPGIDVADGDTDGNSIEANRIGTTADGLQARPNAGGGIRVVGGPDNTVVGDCFVPADGNLISGNTTHGVGVYNSGTTGTQICNNFIGTKAGGNAALPNGGDGVRIQEQATAAYVFGNLVSGNGHDGVALYHAGTTGHDIRLNRIGTNAAISAAIPNSASGIALLQGAASNSLFDNVVAGNDDWGIFVANAGTNGNMIDDNDIGLPGAGNGAGGVILLNGATNNNVEDNTIGWNSGNGGVQIDGSGTTLNDVYRNKIGTNSAGTSAAPNALGVTISNGASNNVIGGVNASLGNVISGNSGYGAGIWNPGTSGNDVRFNKIGTNAAANAALPNGAEGIVLALGSTSSVLRDNVISGNASVGVRLWDSGTSAALERNNIGVGSNPGTPLPNVSHGVHVAGAAGALNLGTTVGTGNVIAHNGGAGVRADGTGLVAFYESSIRDNSGLAIDLGGAGATANDLQDADSGANGLLNMPVITSARVASTVNLTARVKYHGLPAVQLRVHLFYNAQCDATGHGEAEAEPFASATFTTNASGNAEVTILGTAIVGDILSALVSNFSVPSLASELSTCRTAVDNASTLIFDDSFESGLYDAWSSWAP